MEPLTDREWLELDSHKGKSPAKPVRFLGWIYGNLEDSDKLRKLGVKGPMIWKQHDNSSSVTPGAAKKSGIFEKCEITMEVAIKLKYSYPVFAPQTFTGIDENFLQTEDQPLSHGVYYGVR